MEMRFAGDLPLPLRSCGVWKEDASRATSFVVAAVYTSTEGVSVSNREVASATVFRSKLTSGWAHSSDARLSRQSQAGQQSRGGHR